MKTRIIKIYLVATGLFLVIDAIWLGLVARKFYAEQLGFLMKTNINWIAAFLFYFLFTAGLVVFVINPSLEKGSTKRAFLLGSFFGFVTYATYDLTNLATIQNWPILVTVVDLIWGATISSIVSLLTYIFFRKYK